MEFTHLPTNGFDRMTIDLIAFDADDTLWVNEPRYKTAEAKLRSLLEPYAPGDVVSQHLHKIDVGNLKVFGYGVKGYIISMIETAIEVTNGKISGAEISEIIHEGRRMIETPIHLFDYVEETLVRLSKIKNLMMITKGDLLEQEDRIARSGLTKYFSHIEIVSEKTENMYRNLLQKYNIVPEYFMMVGNSMKSDILPIVALGAHAVYIHYDGTWSHEIIHMNNTEHNSYDQIAHIGLLPELVEKIESRG